MRIAVACDWFPPRRGGIETQLLELVTRLRARGHDVDVLTSTPGPSVVDGVGVRRLDGYALPGTQLAFSPRLPGALRRELRSGFDVVHAHASVVSPLAYAAAAAARALGLSTVVTFHSVLRYKRYLLRLADAFGTLSGSHIAWTAVSDLVATQAREALRGAAVTVLPNGVDLAFWRAALHRGSRASGEITLVSAMRLHRKKRAVQLVRAFARAVAGSGVRARLLMVGDGPERRAVERAIGEVTRSGDVHVMLLGWREPRKLRDLYAKSDAFASASRRESFGIAALEARAAGLPVIAMRDAGSSAFLHDENALLCDDDGDLAQAMSRILRDAELRRRLAAEQGSVERYDWSVVIADHERCYARATARQLSGEAVVASA